MKKTLSILVAGFLLMIAVIAFAEPLEGGWSIAANTGVTDETKAIFDKALDGLVGVSYEPIAYLGSQVVAGTNHCFLCKATIVYPDAIPTLALIYIYEDLEGNTEILNIADFDIAAFSSPVEPTAE